MNEELLKITKNPRTSKISVIVPVHNAGYTLKQCLKALKEQTDSNYEVITVDDCSIDNSHEIYKESGFKILRLVANKGQAVARNEGVKIATGEIIAFVDSDTVVPAEWIEKYRQLLTTYKDADMICSGYGWSLVDTQSALFAFHECTYRRLNLPLYIHSSTSSNCVIYRDVFEEVGGYPEYYINTRENIANQKATATVEDSELGFLLSQRKKKIVWSHDNPIKHYFRDSWKKYLRQQIGFVRYMVLSVFKFPKKLYYKGIYSGEKNIPQLIMASMMLLVVLGLFFGKVGMLITVFVEIFGILFFYVFHRRFISYLKNNMKNYAFTQIFFWLIITRLCWVYGVLLGIKDGFYMLWNNYLMKPPTKSKKDNRQSYTATG